MESNARTLEDKLKVLRSRRSKERQKRRKRARPEPDSTEAVPQPETLYLLDPHAKPEFVGGQVVPTLEIAVKEWQRARSARRRSRGETWYIVLNPPEGFPRVTVWRLRKYLKTVGKRAPGGGSGR